MRAALGALIVAGVLAAPAVAAAPPPVKTACGAFTPTAGMRPFWLRTSDGARLYAAEAGGGKTAIVLAHESPADLCGWLPFVPSLTRAGYRVVALDFRGMGLSPAHGAPTPAAYTRDLAAAVTRARADGARRVILMGASFGGAAALAEGWRLRIDGLVSLSGEPEIDNVGFDGVAGVKRLRVPLLLVGSRLDGYCNAADTAHLLRAAASRDKASAVYPGAFHGWDIVEDAPYAAQARKRILAWLAAR
jgi:alpha-beta hydrolase superfamily lysophospholipase